MTADIISLADRRAAAEARDTMQSLHAEFAAHMRDGPGESREAHLVQTFEILTRIWAAARDQPPDGGSRVGGTG